MTESVVVKCSGNIIKNVKGVTVPNSNGLKGIDVAAVLGIVGGDASKNFEVLNKRILIIQRNYLKQIFVNVSL